MSGEAQEPPFSRPGATALGARLAYVLVILLATAAEPAAQSLADFHARLLHAITFDLGGTGIIDAARNILLFAGWGSVWVLTAARPFDRRTLVRATLLGTILSVLVETGQLLSRTRSASLIDVGTDTAGSLLGAMGALLLLAVARVRRERRSYAGFPLVVIAAPYFLAALLQSCFPLLRRDRLPRAWGSPGERLGIAITEFGWHAMVPTPMLELMLFFPAGALGLAALVELGVSRRRSLLIVLAAAVLSFTGAEIVRGASGYPMSWQALALHVLGIVTGALAAARWLPAWSRRWRGRARVRTVAMAYGLVAALWAWRPFLPRLTWADIADNLTWQHFVPLAAYRQRPDLFMSAEVAAQAFLLLPIGCLLAVWPLRRSGWARGVLPGLYLAVVLEVGQIFMVPRIFDVTDILVAWAAVAAGWYVLRRAGYLPYGSMLS